MVCKVVGFATAIFAAVSETPPIVVVAAPIAMIACAPATLVVPVAVTLVGAWAEPKLTDARLAAVSLTL